VAGHVGFGVGVFVQLVVVDGEAGLVEFLLNVIQVSVVVVHSLSKVVFIGLTEIVTFLGFHLADHFIVVFLEVVVTFITESFVIHLLHCIFVKLVIVAVLLPIGGELRIQVAAQTQAHSVILGEDIGLRLIEFAFHVLFGCPLFVHVIALQNVLRGQVKLLLVA
jgi:hypothetical protein